MIYEWLKHKGHNIVVSTYGQDSDNASIECEDCWEVLASRQREGEQVRNYKCTDCKKFYNINKGTYDPEWGFHCIYCGGLEEVDK